MLNLLLKRLFLASALVFCAQPLLGAENFNFNPYFNSANTNTQPFLWQQQQQQQQQQPLPQLNALPWMDVVPQSQNIPLASQYVMTPMGARVILQPIQMTDQPFYSYNPTPIAPNYQGIPNYPVQMPIPGFQDNPYHFPQQSGMPQMPHQVPFTPFQQAPIFQTTGFQPENPSQGMGGMKRLREADTVMDNQNSEMELATSQNFFEGDDKGSFEEDEGYNQLVEMNKTISHEIMRFFLFRQIGQQRDGWCFPIELVHLIINKASIPLSYHLDLERSEILDRNLLKFRFPEFVTRLNLANNEVITNEGLKGFTNLTDLDLCSNKVISDEGIKHLPNLTKLDLRVNKTITNEGLKGLIKLISLKLHKNKAITDEAVKHLTQLTELDLYNNKKITNKGLELLTNLTSLDLRENKIITNEGLMLLTNLTSLNLVHNKTITNERLKDLTNLTNLTLYESGTITCEGIKLLLKLTDYSKLKKWHCACNGCP
jgi:hypothetical protein